MKPSRILCCLAVSAFSAACGGDDPTDVGATCTDDTGAVTVSVNTSGAVPVFNWSPPCAVAFVLIEESGSDRWFVGTDDNTWGSPPDPDVANLIHPPITYGVAPAEAADEYGPDPLTNGVSYDFIIWRAPPGSTADCLDTLFELCMIANDDFMP